jgi:uncharacterized heparinase superfamily protein
MTLTRNMRLRLARLPSLRINVPEAPAVTVRDPWPGDAGRGARLLKGEILLHGSVRVFKPGAWQTGAGRAPALDVHAHGFAWLRDLRVIGTDAARMRARALVADWIAVGASDPIASRPDVTGARIAAWLAHYDFFAASADDEFRQKLMWRVLSDARMLSAALPPEELDGRAFTALRGLLAASVALPDHAAYLSRALRFLPQEIGRQVLPDGGHAERSPAAALDVLRELVDIRGLLNTGGVAPPAVLGSAIDRLSLALRTLRHGDGALALFNGTREEPASVIDLVLNQANRGGRTPASLPDTGFYRLQAGRTVLIADAGAPPPPGLDRLAHAGTLSFELSFGRDRLIVNCGPPPLGGQASARAGAGANPPLASPWTDAARATAAHSTLIIADTSSSELKPAGLGRRPAHVTAERQEANGAHWLEASHDGWKKGFGAIHRRRLYMAESGEDIRGEDMVEAAQGQPYAIRFHLHPTVTANVQQDGEGVLLRIPSAGWRLRAEGALLSLEESIYLGGPEPRRTEQVVLTGKADGAQHVKWAITKVG